MSGNVRKRAEPSRHCNGLFIAPAAGSKLTHEESFAEMASNRSEMKNALEWAESGLSDGLEENSGFSLTRERI